MFSFIMQIEGVEFPDALKSLADRAGVRLASYDPKTRSEKTRIYEICERATQFFEKQLALSSRGKKANDYLRERGISYESISKFRIGFAPNTKNGLSEFLRGHGYSNLEIFKSGVAMQSSSGGSYDRFRGRIIFPIFDLNSQVIGFGGRIFSPEGETPDKEAAKYINTPQTLLYDKSRVLYGLDRAKMKIREEASCILVEGYTDVIACHQAGFENVVATSGTALTGYQLDIIRRYSDNLVTAFDMDIAGDTATRRGIALAQQKGFNIKVITLPQGKDPAEIIQKNKKQWKKAADEPHSIGDFYFKTAFLRYDKATPEGMKDISNILLLMIKQIPSQIERSYWVQKLAGEFNCNESVIWDDLTALKEDPASTNARSDESETRREIEAGYRTVPSEAGEPTTKKSKRDVLYERLLVAGLKDPECLSLLKKRDLGFFDQSNHFVSLLLAIRDYASKNPGGSDDLLTNIKTLSREDRSLLDEILFQEEVMSTFASDVDFKEEFNLCVKALKQILLKESLLKIQRQMREKKQDEKLLKDFQKTSIELAKL